MDAGWAGEGSLRTPRILLICLLEQATPMCAVRGTSTSSASSSATATPVYTATPVAKVQAKVPPAKAAPPPLYAPGATPTAEEL